MQLQNPLPVTIASSVLTLLPLIRLHCSSQRIFHPQSDYNAPMFQSFPLCLPYIRNQACISDFPPSLQNDMRKFKASYTYHRPTPPPSLHIQLQKNQQKIQSPLIRAQLSHEEYGAHLYSVAAHILTLPSYNHKVARESKKLCTWLSSFQFIA